MPVYIEKINGDANRPTNRPTNRVILGQSALVRKLENRKKAENCNSLKNLILLYFAQESLHINLGLLLFKN